MIRRRVSGSVAVEVVVEVFDNRLGLCHNHFAILPEVEFAGTLSECPATYFEPAEHDLELDIRGISGSNLGLDASRFTLLEDAKSLKNEVESVLMDSLGRDILDYYIEPSED